MAKKKAPRKKAKRKPPRKPATQPMAKVFGPTPHVHQASPVGETYYLTLGYEPAGNGSKNLVVITCKNPPCTCVPEGIPAKLVHSDGDYIKIYESDDTVYVCYDPNAGSKGGIVRMKADICKNPPCT